VNAGFTRPLLGLILGQICIHACMAGVRVAAPLHALRSGLDAWSVGVLMALFAIGPMLFALRAGRYADRVGYHRPMQWACALAVIGAAVAAAGQSYGLLCLAALLTGTGANIGIITSQRSAGLMAHDATQRMQVFSWLGLAPALANVVGPVVAGVLIDAAGFGVAFCVLAVMPLASLVVARWVPEQPAPQTPALQPLVNQPLANAAQQAKAPTAWGLLRSPPLLRLLFLNWMLSASWDMHAFGLPLLGHDRGLSASAIGVIFGLFAGAVAAVRLVIPLLAHRLGPPQVLCGAMLLTALVFAAYPFAQNTWLMALCAVVLGLALGAVQPMVMSTLHHITPHGRHGEVIALRSMVVNLSSTVMPLLFGVVGTTLGADPLFWVLAAVLAAGSVSAKRMALWAKAASDRPTKS
jgi:MFS family permease